MIKEKGNILTDIDGNVYTTVKIGNQIWMAENLKVTRYRNGDPIPNVTGKIEWKNLRIGAYCNYDNNSNTAVTYGRLYNWYAINDSRNIAPAGWHVPSDEEWKILEKHLGMRSSEVDSVSERGTDEGGKLKEHGTTHWKSPNIVATNHWDWESLNIVVVAPKSSGFTALPGGFRHANGAFFLIGKVGYWWSSTESGSYAWWRTLDYFYSSVNRGASNLMNGVSVRLVRD